MENINPERSHFEDIEPSPWLDKCKDPGHKPPMHIHIPQGKRYVHICPTCGQRTVLQPQQFTLNSNIKSAEQVLKESGLDFDWMSSKYTKNTIIMTMEAYANQFKL